MARTRVVETAQGKHFRRSARALAQTPLDVGVFDDPDLILIATVNEYGSDDGNVPERGAHRHTYAKLQPKIKAKYNAAAILALQGKATPRQALARVGGWYAGKLRDAIQKWNTPPNADSTIEAKGFNDPLIGPNADYVNAITFRIGDG